MLSIHWGLWTSSYKLKVIQESSLGQEKKLGGFTWVYNSYLQSKELNLKWAEEVDIWLLAHSYSPN